MNLIGHNYIAKEVLTRYNPLIATGVHIPDLVPFLAFSVFSFDEIHEDSDLVYKYLLANDKASLDLALGMMTHSVKYGADKYTRDIESWLFKDNASLRNNIADKIVQASGINIETAKGPRMHNYLWGGMDFYLMDNFPEFIYKIKENYKAVDVNKISKILSQAYNKDLSKVKENIEKHLRLVNKYDLSSKTGFVKFWKDFLAELPEKDNINIDNTLACIGFIEEVFSDNWQSIIDRVVKDIKLRMQPYIQG